MIKILLFGGAGQLGLEIQKRAQSAGAVICAPLEEELDITDAAAVQAMARKVEPECILNTAAYTAVDKAESDAEKAYRVNRDGAVLLAEVAKEIGARFIHLSTDYVFDGYASHPLSENDPVNPLGVYGKSKLEGELGIKEICAERSLIVRTSSLHGQYGANFVHAMLKLFKEKEQIEVVSDQFMSPTWAGWLGEILLELCQKSDVNGVLHASCGGAVSWYDFACAIKECTTGQLETSLNTRIKAVSVDQYKRPAPRPRYSVFDCARLAHVLGREPIPWLNGLKSHLRDIGYSAE